MHSNVSNLKLPSFLSCCWLWMYKHIPTPFGRRLPTPSSSPNTPRLMMYDAVILVLLARIWLSSADPEWSPHPFHFMISQEDNASDGNNNNTNEGVFDVAAFLFISAAAAVNGEWVFTLSGIWGADMDLSTLTRMLRRRRKMRENWKDEWKGKN